MSDVAFVAAAYGAVLIGLALYTVSVWRRTKRARQASLRIRREAGAVDRASTLDRVPVDRRP